MQDINNLKVPPHSTQAEQAVLGGLMLDNDAWDLVSEILVEKDFYRYEHQLIFRAMAELFEQSLPVDVIIIAEKLEAKGELDDVGELNYIGSLVRNTASAANVQVYSSFVREYAVLRQLTQVCNAILNRIHDDDEKESSELIEYAEKLIFDIAESGAKRKGGFLHVEQALSQVVNNLESLIDNPTGMTGVPSGFKALDEMTSGLQKSDLIIVAARPSMGKTSFAMNLAEYAAIQNKQTVAIFSLEMPADSLVTRSISSLGYVNQQNLRTGKIPEDDWVKITSAMTLLNTSKIYIDDTPALRVAEIRSRARRLKREHGLGLIVVDYIQLIQGSGKNYENRTTEVSEISRSLKALAKELEVPVIALSQLNRSLEQRQDKRPVMSDLRDSGAIEQDADVIIFIYRDEQYNPDTTEKGLAEIIIAKQRNGPVGRVYLNFQGQYTRFENTEFEPNW